MVVFFLRCLELIGSISLYVEDDGREKIGLGKDGATNIRYNNLLSLIPLFINSSVVTMCLFESTREARCSFIGEAIINSQDKACARLPKVSYLLVIENLASCDYIILHVMVLG